MRLISTEVLLYTEMVSTNSFRFGNISKFIDNNNDNVVIQLAGNNPNELAYCAHLAEQMGFAGVNLNVGCPSCKIKKANYGAILFKSPNIVSDCVKEMKNASTIPVSVKTRIGVDDHEGYMYLSRFVELMAKSEVDNVVIHARKAYLKGLSPKANRNLPPLNYNIVKDIKNDFPEIAITLNGGINNIEDIKLLYNDFDSIMIGRAIDKNPLMLTTIMHNIFQHKVRGYNFSRKEILSSYMQYVDKKITEGENLIMLLKPLFGFYHGVNNAKLWHDKIISIFNKKDSYKNILDFDLEEV